MRRLTASFPVDRTVELNDSVRSNIFSKLAGDVMPARRRRKEQEAERKSPSPKAKLKAAAAAASVVKPLKMR